MRLGIDIAKIIASEKSITADKLIEDPIIINVRNKILYVISTPLLCPNKKLKALKP